MKLHLPKSLLVAVLAACASPCSWAGWGTGYNQGGANYNDGFVYYLNDNSSIDTTRDSGEFKLSNEDVFYIQAGNMNNLSVDALFVKNADTIIFSKNSWNGATHKDITGLVIKELSVKENGGLSLGVNANQNITLNNIKGILSSISVNGSLTIGTASSTTTLKQSIANSGSVTLNGALVVSMSDGQFTEAGDATYTYYDAEGNQAVNGFRQTSCDYYLVQGGSYTNSLTSLTVQGAKNTTSELRSEAGGLVFAATSLLSSQYYINAGEVRSSSAASDNYVVNKDGHLIIDDKSNSTSLLASTTGAGHITLSVQASLVSGQSTQSKGTLIIDGATLEVGDGTSSDSSIESFSAVTMKGGIISMHNDGSIVNNLTVSEDAEFRVYDSGRQDGVIAVTQLKGTTKLDAKLDVSSTYKGVLTIDELSGEGALDIAAGHNQWGDTLVVNINSLSDYSGVISYRPSVNTSSGAENANNVVNIKNLVDGSAYGAVKIGGLELEGGVSGDKSASASANVDIGKFDTYGASSLGNVSIAAGGTLSIYNRNGVGSLTVNSLSVKGAATVQTTRHSGCYNGTIGINELKSVDGSATLTLKNGSQIDDATVFNLNGGSFAGTINLEANSYRGSDVASNPERFRKLYVNLNSQDVAATAVINFQDPSTGIAAGEGKAESNALSNYITLGLGNDDVMVAGLTGETSNAAVIKSTDATKKRNLTIATTNALSDYSTNATINAGINLIKTGAGKQSFEGSMASFDGTVDVQGGTLGFGSSALGTAGVKVATGATLSYGGDKLSVTGKGGVANLGAASFSVENSSNTVIISGGNSGITATNALLQLEEGASLKLSNVTISESSSVQGYGVAAPVVMAADGTGNTAITRNSVTLENTTVKLGATVPAVVQATAGNAISQAIANEIVVPTSAKVYTFTSDIFNGVALNVESVNVELSSALTDALYGKGYDYVALSFENSTIVSGRENSISVTFEDETLKQLDPSVYLADNTIYIAIDQIPEPTTATLSLLALAALAARRRRK